MPKIPPEKLQGQRFSGLTPDELEEGLIRTSNLIAKHLKPLREATLYFPDMKSAVAFIDSLFPEEKICPPK